MIPQIRRYFVIMLVCVPVLISWHSVMASFSEVPRHRPAYVCAETPCKPIDLTPIALPIELPQGYTSLTDPATGHFVSGTAEDSLAVFSRRPLEPYIIIEGGMFMDTQRGEPHYGIDYSYPDGYLNGEALWVHPIAPGYVTARASCVACFADGDRRGRVEYRWPQYNFGFGDLVIVETPYSPAVSIYVMYAHFNADFVSLGDYVTPEDIIGAAGSSGYSQEIHVHMEVRYGAPGRFWNADFTQMDVETRWLETWLINPAWAVFPENHGAFVAALNYWVSIQKRPPQLP